MKDFVILFEEKEGTSAIVRYLNNLDEVSILHQINNKGWEPFDNHNCGDIKLSDLKKCMSLLFYKKRNNISKVNEIYRKTAKLNLENFEREGKSLGFKMRYIPTVRKNFIPKAINTKQYKRTLNNIFKSHDVVVFIMVRQDIFRWALSKYHGDGTGKKGHLQFKLASGDIKKDVIPKITVDVDKFDKIIHQCEQSHANKKKLLREFQEAGINAYPIFYEDFLESKKEFIKEFLEKINITPTDKSIDDAIEMGGYFKKVHSNDISGFVENHEEVMTKFGEKYINWY